MRLKLDYSRVKGGQILPVCNVENDYPCLFMQDSSDIIQETLLLDNGQQYSCKILPPLTFDKDQAHLFDNLQEVQGKNKSGCVHICSLSLTKKRHQEALSYT